MCIKWIRCLRIRMKANSLQSSTYLIFGWFSVQHRRVVWREPELVVLAEVCRRVAGAADEDKVCHGVCYLIRCLEIAAVWKTLR